MDVRDLAPALLALGQLLDAANASLNGEDAKLKLQVTATERGSFQISFELIQSWTSQVLHFFASEEATGATNLLTWVLGASAVATPSLIWLLKCLKGRTPDKVEGLADNMMRLSIGDEKFVVPIELLRLYQDIAVRNAVQRLVEDPLRKDGIDLFRVVKSGLAIQEVTKGEALYFGKPQLADETLTDETRKSAFSIISLAFKDDNKWRLHDGNTQISATIVDADFMQRVNANQISFAKGDILICEVKFIQTRTSEGLKSEYFVERVVEHRPATRQLPLPISTPGDIEIKH